MVLVHCSTGRLFKSYIFPSCPDVYFVVSSVCDNLPPTSNLYGLIMVVPDRVSFKIYMRQMITKGVGSAC